MLNNEQPQAFSKFRKYVWPIHNHEHKTFIPLLVMFFLISFNYNVLRTMKETLVITAPGAGAEVIPFIKVWAMFPGAVLMTFIFTWLSNRFSKESVFYILITGFLCYFLFFVCYLFPNHEVLHLNGIADSLQSVLPAGCKGFIVMLRNWTFTTFYVASELWGNIILIVLFWGFVNQTTKLEDAKRFYGLLGIGANISCIFSSQVAVYFSRKTYNPNLLGSDAWEQSVFMMLGFVLVCGILTLVLFYWMNKNASKNADAYTIETAKQEKALRGTLSMKESFIHLFKSPYLLYITVIVIAYNVVINLVEVLWKDQMRTLYPNPLDYNLYFNQVATWIGIISTLSALFISGNAIRRFGWTFTALITPAVLLITSVLFFGLLFGREYLEQGGILLFGMGPLALLVFVGSFQNVLGRGAKYTVFDATKEMAYLPLSSETKIKGKSVIDGVCNRLGKSGGSVIHQGLLILFGSFAISAPYVAAILILIIGGWMGAVKLLGKAFNALTGGTETVTKTTYEEKPTATEQVATQN